MFVERPTLLVGALFGIILVLSSCPSELWATEPVGEDPRREDFAPTLSPDGASLAFYSYRNGKLPDIYVLDLKSGEQRRLTSHEDRWDLGPAWAADGGRLYFSSGRDGADSMAIYSIRPDGLDLRQETHPADGIREAEVSFSRDGKQMAFARFGGEKGTVFVVRDLESGIEREVLTASQEQIVKPRLHPDGGEILYASNGFDPKSPFDLYILDIATGGIARLTETGANERMPMWSHDGTEVLFSAESSDKSYDLYIMPRSGGQAKRLTYFDDRLELNSFHSGTDMYFDAGHYGRESGDTWLYKMDLTRGHITRLTGKNEPPVAAEAAWIDVPSLPLFFAVRVEDMERSVSWYRRVFGLVVLDDTSAQDGRWRIVNLRGPGLELELIWDRRDQIAERPKGFTKLGFEVSDVEQIAARIEESGRPRPSVVTFEPHQIRILQLRDPDGNTLQLFTSLREPTAERLPRE